MNSYNIAFKLKPAEPTPSTKKTTEYVSIHWGLHTFVKKKRGVREEVKEKERELKRY